MISRYGIFCKVIELGSFTRAAAEIGYSQSAVSQTVKALEQELGTALVYRHKNGVSLTRDGEAYYPYLRNISSAEAALSQKQDEMQGLENNTIRMGIFTSISRFHLPPVMKRFTEQYPSVKFELMQGDYEDIRKWLQSGKVDFGFVSPEASKGLTSHLFFRQKLVAVMPKNHPLTEKKTVTLEDLAKEPFIIDDEGPFSIPLRVFAQAGLTPDIHFHLYDNDSIMIMVEQGLGISMIDEPFVRDRNADVSVREIKEQPERVITIAWQDWDTMAFAAKRFVKFLLSQPEFQGNAEMD